MEFAYVNLYGDDLDRALAFYVKPLGLALEHADTEHGYASRAAGSVRTEDGRAPPVGRHTGGR